MLVESSILQRSREGCLSFVSISTDSGETSECIRSSDTRSRVSGASAIRFDMSKLPILRGWNSFDMIVNFVGI